MTIMVAAQKRPPARLSRSPISASGPGTLSLSEKIEHEAAEGQQQPDDLSHGDPFAEQEMAAEQRPERHGVDQKRAPRHGGVVEADEDQQELDAEERAGEHASPKRAVPLEQRGCRANGTTGTRARRR